MASSHAAADSALGYYHQGMYALIILLECTDDSGAILIEGDDDVELVGATRTLHQLKHSLQLPPPMLTIASVQLWKTLKVWIDAKDPEARLVLLTCSAISPNDPLSSLIGAVATSNAVCVSLLREAQRVEAERAVAASAGDRLPHAERWVAVDAFLQLSAAERLNLVGRIVILPNSPRITEIGERVEAFAKTFVLPNLRSAFADRLMEWWSLRVCRSLLNEVTRSITRQELFRRQREILLALDEDALPDEFGHARPDDEWEDLTIIMEAQIDLVDGGVDRKRHAAIARWRARNQRARWLERDLSLSPELTSFDETLVERWRERFAPGAYDLRDADERECRASGRQLLDWSHQQARNEVGFRDLRTAADYLVPGSYQQLAEELKVGWHRDWEQRLTGWRR